MPLILRLLNQFSCAKVYINIALRGSYNLVRIWEGNEWKKTFRYCYGHFEYVMVPFGFINTPSIFQHLINDVFHEYLDDFVICSIDNIFIFSKNVEDHERHVRLVLEKL